MTDEIDELANSLEEHASNRADFRNVNNSQLRQMARLLVIARSQVDANNAPEETQTSGRYTSELIDKKNRYFHSCAEANIDVEEGERIWWSVVYDGLAPYRRTRNV